MAILIQNDVTEIDGYKQQPTTMWFCKNAADIATIPSTVSPGSKAMYKKDQNGGLAFKMKDFDGTWFDI